MPHRTFSLPAATHPMKGEADDQLLGRVANEDKAAHRALCERFHSRIHYIARGKGLSDADCDEVVMDTFLAIWQSAASYRGDAPVGAWIGAIASRKAASKARGAYRDTNRLVPWALDEDDESGAAPEDRMADESSLGANPEESAQTAQLHRCIGRCFADLSPTLRDVASRFWLCGEKEVDIAAELAIPLNTVKSRKLAAREKLWPCLQRCREGAA
ncbi:MAG: sigma-70 family RNA polymerase sigma factor [Candidatus Hydrogenedentes bacterium]|nr:sigma-70 family RNA polymerase sigma factor [Candidatus Hydrogenedentota bacterium]